MLSLQNIKDYYPNQLWGFERFMLREYLQYKILEIIYNDPNANQFIFMGGTALRIIHNNNRFSEDLEFDNYNIPESDFGMITGLIQKKMEQQGFGVDMRNVFKGAYHCHIKFPGLLKELGLSGQATERVLIRLDTEPQHFDYQPVLKLINKFDVFTEIATTPEDVLLAQKFYAIINRPRNKGRDFYDLVFLLGKNIKPNYNYLEQKAKISNPGELKEIVIKKLNSINMKEMAKDVSPFLCNTTDAKKVLLFEKYFKSLEL
ncbi:MAG: nucleotidyl transferase AbiEii/AbiGii toxin family protein [Bacteroidales bacterium]|nr:nucleotidyl transferase AbiEii/AbiGii toxin family protein [Bacteroidales bacterium]